MDPDDLDPPPRTSDEPSRRGGLLTTGEMARLTRNTLRTVRFYEEVGILRPVQRSEGGHRLFHPDELERLRFISDMREAGFSLEEIRAVLDIKRDAVSGEEASRLALGFLAERIEELDRKMRVLARLQADFQRAREILAGCGACRESSFYPHDCGSCFVMVAHHELPASVRVLWSIGSSKKRVGEGT